MRKKMVVSHFRGGNNLVRTIVMSFNFIILISFFPLFGAPPALVAGREISYHPLVQLWGSSREDELVQLAGYGDEKLSTVLIAGTLVCQYCDSHGKAHPLPVPGAVVAVSCHTDWKTRKSNWVKGSTDEFGDFLIDLPSHLHAIPNLDKRCVVKILRLPRHSLCHPAFTGKQTGLKLSSVGNGIRTYTAQTLHLTPKPSQACINRANREYKGALVKVY